MQPQVGERESDRKGRKQPERTHLRRMRRTTCDEGLGGRYEVPGMSENRVQGVEKSAALGGCVACRRRHQGVLADVWCATANAPAQGARCYAPSHQRPGRNSSDLGEHNLGQRLAQGDARVGDSIHRRAPVCVRGTTNCTTWLLLKRMIPLYLRYDQESSACDYTEVRTSSTVPISVSANASIFAYCIGTMPLQTRHETTSGCSIPVNLPTRTRSR